MHCLNGSARQALLTLLSLTNSTFVDSDIANQSQFSSTVPASVAVVIVYLALWRHKAPQLALYPKRIGFLDTCEAFRDVD